MSALHAAGRIAAQLRRLHANNLQVVPQIGATKTPFPMRESCPCCPGWRDSGDWDEANGRWKRTPPQRGHAQDEAEAARQMALVAGGDAHDGRRAYADAEERVLRSHDTPDRPDFWLWHVLGADAKGKFYHRGVYSHRDHRYGLDVMWDIDKGQDPQGKVGAIMTKLAELGLTPAVYANTSFSGNGMHVRLCLDFLAESWLRMAFGRKLLEACGFKPGNNPAKGETESFPKQDEADYVGNMIGLPCSKPRMQISATCVLDRDLQPVQDLDWTAHRLESVIQAPQSAFFTACRQLGIDPEKKPEVKPKPKPVDRSKPRVIRTRKGTLTYQKGSDRLVAEVRRRVDMTTFLAQLGRKQHPGDKFCCPQHEPEGGALSFHVFSSTQVGEVHDRYQCFGDCAGTDQATGDVIALASNVWGMTYRKALHRLAQEHGVRIADYKSDVKTKAGLSDVPFRRLAAWSRAMFPRTRKPNNALRALAKVFFTFGMSYERAAATLWKAGGAGLTKKDAYANVAAVLDRVQQGQQSVGITWLRRNFGLVAMRDLGEMLAGACGVRQVEAISRTCGFTRYQVHDEQRKALRDVFIPLAKPATAADKRASIRAMLKAPTGCNHFSNEVWGDGQKNGEIPLPCRVYQVCPSCALVRMVGAHSVVCGTLGCGECDGCRSDSACKYSWESSGPFYGVWVTVPRERVAELKKAVNRKGDSKLQAVGTCLKTGAAKILYITNSKLSGGVIASACRIWCGVNGVEVEIKRGETCDYEVAATWAFDAQHSVQLYSDVLLRAHEKDRASDQELLDYVSWIKGKQLVVARSKRGLPWPPRELVRSATAAENESELRLYPGQRLTFKLKHCETGIILGERGESSGPWTCSTAMTTAQFNQAFNAKIDSLRQEQRALRTPTLT